MSPSLKRILLSSWLAKPPTSVSVGIVDAVSASKFPFANLNITSPSADTFAVRDVSLPST